MKYTVLVESQQDPCGGWLQEIVVELDPADNPGFAWLREKKSLTVFWGDVWTIASLDEEVRAWITRLQGGSVAELSRIPQGNEGLIQKLRDEMPGASEDEIQRLVSEAKRIGAEVPGSPSVSPYGSDDPRRSYQ